MYVSDNTAHELANLFGILIFGSVALFVCGILLLGLITIAMQVFIGSPSYADEDEPINYAK